jgi:hypothetical protein
MELLNILVIIVSSTVCIGWSIIKRIEISRLRIELDKEDPLLRDERGKDKWQIYDDEKQLNETAEILQNISMGIINRINLYCMIIFFIMSIVVWVFFEQKLSDYGQPIWFFIGGFGQISITTFMFRNYRFYDVRIIFMARLARGHAFDYMIKLNSYITMLNQSLNMIVFSSTYYLSSFFSLNINSNKLSASDFERFHRRFLSFGFGSIFAYFLIKSLSNLMIQGTRMCQEIMARQVHDGIPSDHPRNPASIIHNISKGFLKTIHNCLEVNGLTNMGLCLFQDFFVIKYVYQYDRGYLNGPAIYGMSMLGSLISMIFFRKRSHFRYSDQTAFMNDLPKLMRNGYICIITAGLQVTFTCFFIFYNTFPDSIAVYNPFKTQIGLRGVDYLDSFMIFASSFLVIVSLVINSMYFTGPNGTGTKNMEHNVNICFSMTLLKADYYSYIGTVLPYFVFFGCTVWAYHLANVFGVSLMYLGLITYYQVIQFFENFETIYYFYLAILEAGKDETIAEQTGIEDGFSQIIHFCDTFSCFSSGASLFINKILCFTILVDSFNMSIVKTIVLVDPYYLIAIASGCSMLLFLTSMDLRSLDNFIKFLLIRIRTFVTGRINNTDFEPPMVDIARDLLTVSFINELCLFYIPVSPA